MNDVLQFPGLARATPHATACVIKEQTLAEPSDGNTKTTRRESSKASVSSLSYTQKNSSFPEHDTTQGSNRKTKFK
jgi:hypothetical protein